MLSNDIICLQWIQVPIQRCTQLTQTIWNVWPTPSSWRITSQNPNSFYYCLGLGYLQPYLRDQQIADLNTNLELVHRRSTQYLQPAERSHFAQIPIWLDLFMEYACHTDLVDYTLEFDISLTKTQTRFNLSKFCLHLGQLLVILSLEDSPPEKLDNIRRSDLSAQYIQSWSDLAELILYPRNSTTPFHLHWLEMDMFQYTRTTLRVHETNEPGQIHIWPHPDLDNNITDSNFEITILYCDNNYILLNSASQTNYSHPSHPHQSETLVRHILMKQRDFNQLQDNTIIPDAFIRYLNDHEHNTSKYTLIRSGKFCNIIWNDLNTNVTILIPRMVEGALYLLEMDLSIRHITLYSTASPNDHQHQVLRDQIQHSTGHRWTFHQTQIASLNDNLPLSLCYHILLTTRQHNYEVMRPSLLITTSIAPLEEFLRIFIQYDYREFHNHPLSRDPNHLEEYALVPLELVNTLPRLEITSPSTAH